MRLLHTSDWHLGKRLESFSRLDEQRAVLNEICTIAQREQVDAVIISGDLFDTYNPPTEAVDLFYKTLKRLANNGKRAVIAIAGNHDSPDRIEAPDPLARECGILFAGYPNSQINPFKLDSGLEVVRSEPGFIELQLPGIDNPLRILLTPYANELRLKTFLGHEDSEEALREVLHASWTEKADTYCDDKGVNILAAHLLMMKEGSEQPEEPDDEKPILFIGGAQAIFSKDVPDNIQYVALGHLHRKQTIDKAPCPVVYSGTPLAYSFGEANQDKYVMLINAQPGKPADVSEILLNEGKRLLRKRFDDIDKAVTWLGEHPEVFVELTIVSDTFLSADDRKRLNDAHESIVTLIPEIAHKDENSGDNASSIDLNKSMDELFIDFFRSKKGQEPNERMMNLFKEVLADEKE
ncbi:MAG: exonuclease subunit SbcD [Bacteroidota bacterium]|nr:exonuclease subunit SbcD [Bacteroidota bacterium]